MDFYPAIASTTPQKVRGLPSLKINVRNTDGLLRLCIDSLTLVFEYCLTESACPIHAPGQHAIDLLMLLLHAGWLFTVSCGS